MIIEYVKHQDLHRIKHFLETGGDVNEVDDSHWTPLMYACFLGNVDIAKVLIRYGSSVSSWSFTQKTPMNLVARNGCLDVLKLLLEHGADINEMDMEGWTPVLHAAQNGHVKMVKFLLENGANITQKSHNGHHTAFLRALEHYDVNLLEVMLKYPVDANDFLAVSEHVFIKAMGLPYCREFLETNLDDLSPENYKKWQSYRLKKLFL